MATGLFDHLQSKIRTRHYLIFLNVTVFILYRHNPEFSFTNWDDKHFILENPLLQSPSFFHTLQLFIPGSIKEELLYIPITYFSYMLEVLCFGFRAEYFHITNVVLHAINTSLVMVLIKKWASSSLVAFCTAGIFAVHPLQVESVSWVMGRKDLLATLFALGSCIAYQNFMLTGRNYFSYGSMGLFLLAVLSKPTMIVLPLIFMWMYLFWGKKERKKILPILATTFGSFLLYLVNNTSTLPSIPLARKLYHALFIPAVISEWFSRILLLDTPRIMYLRDDLLSHSDKALSLASYLLPLCLLGAIFWELRRRIAPVSFALLCSATAFLPSVSLIILDNREFFTADRYGYFPLIPLFFLGCYPLRSLTKYVRLGYFMVWISFTAFAFRSTAQQTMVWKNSRSLWDAAVKENRKNPIAHHMLGTTYFEQGNREKAQEYYHQAILLRPDYADAYYSLGKTYAENQDFLRAVTYYRRAIRINSDFIAAHYNLGILYYQRGDMGEALRSFDHVLRRDPAHGKSWYTCGLIYKTQQRYQEALYAFERSLTYDFVKGRFQQGIIYHRQGEVRKAIDRYEEVLRLAPNHNKARYNLLLLLGLTQFGISK